LVVGENCKNFSLSLFAHFATRGASSLLLLIVPSGAALWAVLWAELLRDFTHFVGMVVAQP
jgi:hypothetical protein